MEPVELATHRVLLAGDRRQLVREEGGQAVVGDAGRVGVVGQIACEGCGKMAVSGRGLRDERGEEPVVGGIPRDLAEDLGDLAPGRYHALRQALAEGLRISRDGFRQRRHPRGDGRPVLDRLGRHEVEHGTDVLCGRGDHVEVAEGPLRIVELEFQLERSGEILLGHGVDRVRHLGNGQIGEGATSGIGAGRDARGRIVREAMVVLEAADVRRDDRIEVRDRVDPRLRDRVDRRGGAFRRCHAPSLEDPGPAQAGVSVRPHSSPRRGRSARPAER